MLNKFALYLKKSTFRCNMRKKKPNSNINIASMHEKRHIHLLVYYQLNDPYKYIFNHKKDYLNSYFWIQNNNQTLEFAKSIT